MKKILVLVDFSDNESALVQSAAMFSIKLKAELLLFHCYIENSEVASESASFTENIKVGRENRQTWLNSIAEKIKTIVLSDSYNSYQPLIDLCYCEGGFVDHLQIIINTKHINMVIIGPSSLDNTLFGSCLNVVITQAICPVLVVPKVAMLNKIERVIFATNFSEPDIIVQEYLLNLAQLLQFQLENLHMNLYCIGTRNIDLPKKEEFEKDYLNVLFRGVNGKHVISRYKSNFEHQQTAILCFSYDQHGCFLQMLKMGFLGSAFEKCEVPFLIFPTKSTQVFHLRLHKYPSDENFYCKRM